MKLEMKKYRTYLASALLMTAVHVSLGAPHATAQKLAETLIREAAVDEGYIAHLGCGDGSLTADLHANDAFFVHGLDVDARHVKQARQNISSKGVYGKISVSSEEYGKGIYRIQVK